MVSMPSEPRDAASARPRHRWVIELLLVVVLVHTIILTLWLAPASPIRQAAGDGRLASYVDPYFQQGRDVIGIGTQQVDESFSIRAFVAPEGGGKGKATDWIDLTRLDNQANRHDLAASRVHLIARRLATNLNLAMFNLTEAQRKLVRELTADELPSAVKIKLEQAGGKPDAVRFFQAYDQMATQFTSLYAQSRWDGRVVQVQFRVGRRTVPPYADRGTTSLGDVDFLMFSFGWRRTFRGSAEARETFDSYVKK
jgi:hypothetical protein